MAKAYAIPDLSRQFIVSSVAMPLSFSVSLLLQPLNLQRRCFHNRWRIQSRMLQRGVLLQVEEFHMRSASAKGASDSSVSAGGISAGKVSAGWVLVGEALAGGLPIGGDHSGAWGLRG